MEYLVTMTTDVPDGTPDEAVADVRSREAAHSRELAFANVRDERFFDLLAFPIDRGEPRTVLRHDGSGMRAAILADGGIVISAHRDRLQHHHLLHVSPAETVDDLRAREAAMSETGRRRRG